MKLPWFTDEVMRTPVPTYSKDGDNWYYCLSVQAGGLCGHFTREPMTPCIACEIMARDNRERVEANRQ